MFENKNPFSEDFPQFEPIEIRYQKAIDAALAFIRENPYCESAEAMTAFMLSLAGGARADLSVLRKLDGSNKRLILTIFDGFMTTGRAPVVYRRKSGS